MVPVRQKNDPVRIFFVRLGLVALLGLVVFAASAVWNVYGKEQESLMMREQAEAKLAELSAQETHLHSQLEKLKTDRGREEVLREQYLVGKDGEGLIIIVEPPVPIPAEEPQKWESWVSKYLPFWAD